MTTKATSPAEIRKFRKKPLVVEAWTVRELNRAAALSWKDLPQCVRESYERGGWIFGVFGPPSGHGGRGIYVRTLEGSLFADEDDWIIRGVKGEFYPCKPDIFAATYEPVDHLSADPSGGSTLELNGLIARMRQWLEPAVDDESRCAICAWPLMTDEGPDGGCVRGNCSMRPLPDRFYAPERAKRECPHVSEPARYPLTFSLAGDDVRRVLAAITSRETPPAVSEPTKEARCVRK